MITARRCQAYFQVLKSNKIFELFVISVIIASALLIGVKTYPISDTMHTVTVALDYFITIFFVLELSIRFIGDTNKKRFFHNGWNVFDTLIVVISLIPIDNSEMALIARLVRVFRVLRMISIIPELRILLASLLKALPQLGYVMLLMFIIFYIYAAIGATLFSSINEDLWGDITISLLTLFRVMTFEDWTDVMYETMEVYPLSWSFYLTFIFFTAFAFLNMVIGIVVNVMEQEHEKARKEAAEENDEPTLADLQQQIAALTVLVQQQQSVSLQPDQKSIKTDNQLVNS
nr:ion transporter [Flocculibacter collagenilyticus]